MTYIGNPQGTGFSKIDSQQFSGTGSKTAYTMRHPVSQAEHVAVYVNNVCLLYTSPSPRDPKTSRMPSSA